MVVDKIFKGLLEKHFYLVIGTNTVQIACRLLNKTLSLPSVALYINKLIGVKKSDGLKIVLDWFKVKKEILKAGFIAFLNKYRVHLGRIDWVLINSESKEVRIEDVLKELEEFYDSKIVIRTFFNEWFEERILEESLRITNNEIN